MMKNYFEIIFNLVTIFKGVGFSIDFRLQIKKWNSISPQILLLVAHRATLLV